MTLISGDDEIEIRDAYGSFEVVPKFDDTEIALMALGLLVSGVGFIVASTYLIFGYLWRNRGR